jgi:acyl dehydratase
LATPGGERIAHGVLVVAMASGMANWMGHFERATIALVAQTARYDRAVQFGATTWLVVAVKENKETSKYRLTEDGKRRCRTDLRRPIRSLVLFPNSRLIETSIPMPVAVA